MGELSTGEYTGEKGSFLWKTRLPNFHTSSATSWTAPSAVASSEKMTRSASAPASREPLTSDRPSISAGVDVTALRTLGILVPDHLRKLFTHSMRVMELLRRKGVKSQHGWYPQISGRGLWDNGRPLSSNSPSCYALGSLER